MVGLADCSLLSALRHLQDRAGRESRSRGSVALRDPKGQATESPGQHYPPQVQPHMGAGDCVDGKESGCLMRRS